MLIVLIIRLNRGLLFFKCKSSLRTNDVLAHCFASFLRLARANGAINSPVQLESLIEVVRAFDRFATPFVKNCRYHFDQRGQGWIA